MADRGGTHYAMMTSIQAYLCWSDRQDRGATEERNRLSWVGTIARSPDPPAKASKPAQTSLPESQITNR
eukprot:14922179-Alexandrium_andersonii.AAC.1